MNNYEKKWYLENLVQFRELQKKQLAVVSSIAAYDMMLQLAVAFVDREPVRVKEVFVSDHSYTAVRMSYKNFIDSDLIYLSNDPYDKRIKYIKPTIKFDSFINSYLDTVGTGNLQQNS
jgi:hypothetical protein